MTYANNFGLIFPFIWILSDSLDYILDISRNIAIVGDRMMNKMLDYGILQKATCDIRWHCGAVL